MKYFLFILILIPSLVQTQNLDKLHKKEKVSVSGGLNFNSGYTSNFGNAFSRNPFTWNLSGRINVQILDFSLPFTFSYSNLGSRYTQPFNFTSISPKYKWFQAHIGLTSMNFSQYSLSGRPFLGAGIELSFKKIKIKTMFGRLNKAIEFDLEQNNLNEIAYKRLGGALSVSYQHKQNNVEVILMKAIDLKSSLLNIPTNSQVTPKDNFISEFKGKTKLFKILDIKLNYALSILTDNTRLEQVGYEANTMSFLINTNQSTSYNHMIDGSIGITDKIYSVSLLYTRVGPKYYSLASYFINNDFERYTGKLSLKLLKNKLNFSGSFGYQRNNLKNESKAKTNRFVTSVSLTGLLSKKMTLSANYSNFNSFTIGKDQTDPFYDPTFDSLKLFQLNQTANLVFNLRLGGKSKPQNMSIMMNYVQTIQAQGALDNPGFFGQGISVDSKPMHVVANIISYSYLLKAKELSIATSANFNMNFNEHGSSYFLGPNLSLGKKILNKTGNINGGITYNFNKNQALNLHVLNYKVNFTYNPEFWDKKYGKINFSVSGSYMQRFGIPQSKMEQQFSVLFGIGYAI